MNNKLDKLKQNLSGLWRGTLDALCTGKQLLVSLGQDFTSLGCQKNAAALTYATMFALVPTMTVVYWLVSVLPVIPGASEQFESQVLAKFFPQIGTDVLSYLSGFSEKARSLGGVGAGLMVVTAYMMLTNIEKIFNTIWGVSKARRGLVSFLLYWAVLSIGPIMVLGGLVVNTYLLSKKLLFSEYDLIGVMPFFYQVLPWILASAAFTLLFVAVPNCRVPLKYGVIGGVVTALCFELLKRSFGWLVANSSFQSVYGAFAALPLFLLWVNLVWMVILSGAILVRTLAEQRYLLRQQRLTQMSAALLCLNLFYERSQVGGTVSDYDCYRLGIDVVQWQSLRAKLIQHNWIVETNTGHYVLSRNLSKVNLWDLAEVVEMRLDELDAAIPGKHEAPWVERYRAARERLSEQAKKHFEPSLETVLASGAPKLVGEKDEFGVKSAANRDYSEQVS